MKEEEKVIIDSDHIEELIKAEMYREALAYIVKKFYKAMRIELTDKGALEISINMFETVKSNTDLEEKQILANFIVMSIQEEQTFFNIIRISLLNVGLKLMKKEEA